MVTEKELWMPVPGYEGLYEVSNLGNVRSLFRFKKQLKWNITRNGYATVQLFKQKQSKRVLVHRLVAMAFIQNPENHPQVNHINENKLDNSARNLEWVTAKENMNHGTRLQRQLKAIDYSTESRKQIARVNGRKACKPVVQMRDGKVVARFNSAKQASIMTGLNHSHICECASGKRYKTVGGYNWKYERNDDLLGFPF